MVISAALLENCSNGKANRLKSAAVIRFTPFLFISVRPLKQSQARYARTSQPSRVSVARFIKMMIKHSLAKNRPARSKANSFGA